MQLDDTHAPSPLPLMPSLYLCTLNISANQLRHADVPSTYNYTKYLRRADVACTYAKYLHHADVPNTYAKHLRHADVCCLKVRASFLLPLWLNMEELLQL